VTYFYKLIGKLTVFHKQYINTTHKVKTQQVTGSGELVGVLEPLPLFDSDDCSGVLVVSSVVT
jgi:hypothetical protein